jgi:2-hydroxychromene-2-carboxylate isomerase
VRRRTILAGTALLAGPLLMIRAMTGRNEPLSFEPLRDPPGFRWLDAGRVTAVSRDPFLGLSVADAPPRAEPLPLASLCPTLFGEGPIPASVVPIASFSDYFCPFCRELTARLAVRDGDGVRLTWHELPLLGGASEAAARAALAADLQGAYAQFHARLMRAAFQPNTAYLTQLSDGLGLDTPRFLADVDSETVETRLDASRRAASRLGIGATPALVVGRTVVSGLISEADLDQLVAIEREEGPLPC